MKIGVTLRFLNAFYFLLLIRWAVIVYRICPPLGDFIAHLFGITAAYRRAHENSDAVLASRASAAKYVNSDL